MEEQLLITGCKRAESWARKKLYESYAPVMLAICMRYVNDKELARDLMHDGFIKIYTHIGQYAGNGSFEGWMKRVFVTTVLEFLRKKDALRLSISVDEYNELPNDVDVSALSHLSAEELLGCIASLPQGYRTVFNLFAIEGFTHKEIAEMLQISESTSKTQFIRARKQLQKNVQSLLKM